MTELVQLKAWLEEKMRTSISPLEVTAYYQTLRHINSIESARYCVSLSEAGY